MLTGLDPDITWNQQLHISSLPLPWPHTTPATFHWSLCHGLGLQGSVQVSLEILIHTPPHIARRREEGYPSLVVRLEPECFFPAEYVLARSSRRDKTRGNYIIASWGNSEAMTPAQRESECDTVSRCHARSLAPASVIRRTLIRAECGTRYSGEGLDMEVSQNMTD